MIDASGANPAIPIPFPTEATIVPATWVPCPWPSFRPFPPDPEASVPVRIWFAGRSFWVAETPVSTTATLTPAPRLVCHAVSARSFDSPHMLDQYGSFVDAIPTCDPAPGAEVGETSSASRCCLTSSSTDNRLGFFCAVATVLRAAAAPLTVLDVTTGLPPLLTTDTTRSFEAGDFPRSFNDPSTTSAGR